MKWINTLLTICLVTTLAVTAISQQQPSFQDDLDDIICKEQQRASAFLQPNQYRNFAADETDIYYQEMHWDIDPAINYIKGVITYRFKSKLDSLEELILDLSNALQVNYIVRGNDTLSYNHTTDQLLYIDLGKTLTLGESDQITISYEGTPPANGFGSFVQSTHNNIPVIWTLSEPYGVRDWWPGKQDLVDKIDSMDVYVTTPLEQLAAGNGTLVSITEENGKLVHHWRHRHPIASYLVALAVTNYASFTLKVPVPNADSIPVLNYIYPENLAEAQNQLVSAVDIMTLYNELFGIYPFADEKYGHAQFGWGGGMEHQTMTFLVNFNFGLVAHEMAHQWFGDKVTCGSWREIWLNEGFATYLTGLTYENFSHDQYWPLWKTSTINSATSQPSGSVYVDDTTSVNRIFSGRLSYSKGGYLLHMLRWVNGDENFFAACRDYLNYPGTAYDFGTTNELKGYLEAHSGLDLTGFFADWYYGQGYPSYHLKWIQQGDSLIINVNQAQSDPSVSYFEMPLPVWIYRGGIPEQIVLQNDFQDQRFAFEVGGAHVDSIQFDPEYWILSKNNTVTALTTATENPGDNPFIKINPNPANSIIQISGTQGDIKAYLINASGTSVELVIQNQRADVSYIPAGLYTLIIEDRNKERLAVRTLSIIH